MLQYFENATQYLLQGDWIILKHGYDQLNPQYLLLNGFSSIKIHQDLANIDRAKVACLL